MVSVVILTDSLKGKNYVLYFHCCDVVRLNNHTISVSRRTQDHKRAFSFEYFVIVLLNEIFCLFVSIALR